MANVLSPEDLGSVEPSGPPAKQKPGSSADPAAAYSLHVRSLVSKRIVTVDDLRRLLDSRDRVQEAMAEPDAPLFGLSAADSALRRQALTRASVVQACADARQTFKPTETVWWWNLDKLPNGLALGLVPSIIYLISLAVSTACVADICSKLLAAGAEPYAVFISAAQAGVVSMKALALSERGKAGISGFLSKFSIRLEFRPWLLTSAAVLATGGLFALHQEQDRLAGFFAGQAERHKDGEGIRATKIALALNPSGATDLGNRLAASEGTAAAAETAYTFAVDASPATAAPHERLAEFYERKIHDSAKAASEYKTAQRMGQKLTAGAEDLVNSQTQAR